MCIKLVKVTEEPNFLYINNVLSPWMTFWASWIHPQWTHYGNAFWDLDFTPGFLPLQTAVDSWRYLWDTFNWFICIFSLNWFLSTAFQCLMSSGPVVSQTWAILQKYKRRIQELSRAGAFPTYCLFFTAVLYVFKTFLDSLLCLW